MEVIELAEADMTEGSLHTEEGDATRAMAAAAAAAAAVTPPPPPPAPPTPPPSPPLTPPLPPPLLPPADETARDVGTKEWARGERFAEWSGRRKQNIRKIRLVSDSVLGDQAGWQSKPNRCQ